MAKLKTNLMIGLALAVVAGIGLAVSSAEAAPAPVPGLEQSGGMVLTGDCEGLTVTDVGGFMAAFEQRWRSEAADEWLDAGDAEQLEQFLIGFVESHFPGCEPEDSFTWTTTVPTELTRTWEEVLTDLQIFLDLLPPDHEGASPGDLPPYDITSAARALAIDPHGTVEPYPSPTSGHDPPLPPPPLPSPPLPPPPLPDPPDGGSPDGAAEPWSEMPENALQAVTADQILELAVERAMEPAGQLSPFTNAIYFLYDPEHADVEEMQERTDGIASQNPGLTIITASLWDTQEKIGLPREAGSIGYVLQAVGSSGKYLYPEQAYIRDFSQGAPAEEFWLQLVDHALGHRGPMNEQANAVRS